MSFFSSIGSFFTSIRDFFAAPATIVAEQNLIATIEKVDEAIVCFIAGGAGLAASIEAQVNAGPSNIGTVTTIYTVSNAICVAMKGVPTGATATNVTAVTAVTG